MKKKFLLQFLLIFFFLSNAQTNLDSLWAVWQDETQQDTTRLQAMGTFIWDGYMFSQPDSAFYYAQLHYDFAKKNDLKYYMSYATSAQGTSFLIKGDYVIALDYIQKSLSGYQEIESKGGIAGALNKIGVIYMEQGVNVKAINYFQRSLKIREELGDKTRIATTLYNIGIIYDDLGEYGTALTYYQRCLDYYKEMGYKKGIGSSLLDIGMVYSSQGDNVTALDYCQRSLLIAEEIGDKLEIAESLRNIGYIYKDQSDYVTALDYFQKSLIFYKGMRDMRDISTVLIGMGSIYYNQGAFMKSIVACDKSYLMALEVEDIVNQRDACKCLYDGYKSLGNKNKALEYHEKMLVLSDSLNTNETSKMLQQMEFSKEVLADSLAQVEKNLLVKIEHDTEVSKINKTRNIFIASGLLALLLAAGFFSLWRYVKKTKDVISKERDRSENLLLNILPEEIAHELKTKGKADAREFEMVSILFTDFKGFTEASAKLSAQNLVAEINTCFKAFDGIVDKYGIEKIKTIGDSYMAVGGLPVPSEDSVKNTVLAGIDMQAYIFNRKVELNSLGQHAFQMRVGIHTGPVVAGIVGVKKFQYDIWGDSVNTASRMESNGEVGKVNISHTTYELIKKENNFVFEKRGKIKAKGKGILEMFFVKKTL